MAEPYFYSRVTKPNITFIISCSFFCARVMGESAMCTCDRQVQTSRVTCYGSTDPISKWMKNYMINKRRRQGNSKPVLVASEEVGLAEEYGG